jgi:hypothetical protein
VAVALAMLWGFDRTLLVGAGLYLVTFALVARGALPTGAPPAGTP